MKNYQLISLFTFANVYCFNVSSFPRAKTLLIASSLWLAEGQTSLSCSITLIGSRATIRWASCEQKKQNQRQEVRDPQGPHGNAAGGPPIIVESQYLYNNL